MLRRCVTAILAAACVAGVFATVASAEKTKGHGVVLYAHAGPIGSGRVSIALSVRSTSFRRPTVQVRVTTCLKNQPALDLVVHPRHMLAGQESLLSAQRGHQLRWNIRHIPATFARAKELRLVVALPDPNNYSVCYAVQAFTPAGPAPAKKPLIFAWGVG